MTTLVERHGEGAYEGEGSGGQGALGMPPGAHGPEAVPLERPAAADPGLTGSKAANLARAARAGLPVLPGFVIPSGVPDDSPALREAWRELSEDGTRPLVVRSSSSQEDTGESSQAGRFDSVLDVRGPDDFRTAVRAVRASAQLPDGTTAPMAVLVQPMLTARVGGVMFGADPVAGRTDRLLVSVVSGGPDTLVSGVRAGTDHWLSPRGRLLRVDPPGEGGAVLGRAELIRLARLARRARQVFGGPQDIEFGFDEDGRLWLFQSRPITAMAARPARGARLLGPGPVAETLPEQLMPLEEDLWVAPMARGLAAALDIGGTAPRRLLRTVPVVTSVGGRAAADLRLLGALPPRHPWLALLNPAPGARRLTAAWRVGRLTGALPGLAVDLVADIDRQLAEIPRPDELPGSALVSTLRWSRAALVSLHAQESLAGALLRDTPRTTAAGSALAVLADARARRIPDDRVLSTEPLVLALTSPSLRDRPHLPPDPGTGAGTAGPQGMGRPGIRGGAVDLVRPRRGTADDAAPPAAAPPAAAPPAAAPLPALPPREALRLRIRWVQELQVRLVREAAHRLRVRGVLDDPARVGLLRWAELIAALEGGPLPGDVRERVPGPLSAPLPDAFRIAEDGTLVAERARSRRAERRRSGRTGGEGSGRGVSGGRAVGTAWDGTGPPPDDAVLVVRTLDPALAPLLPRLTGLVAQTGSPLSHLAVLSREYGLPAVVGAEDAVRRFPPGTRMTLDGRTGEVRPDPATDGRAPGTDGAGRGTESRSPGTDGGAPSTNGGARAATESTPPTRSASGAAHRGGPR
ncbi:PEP/pyruvate-binding domain-containing protein [Streptomyces sp. NPDC096205]|uniref:PEP/pyruvate-binding domain-containing protein n=1 Tax=Streptomyces sp. NPDC096205 TaxID=3366081 RepID=UPI0037F48041